MKRRSLLAAGAIGACGAMDAAGLRGAWASGTASGAAAGPASGSGASQGATPAGPPPATAAAAPASGPRPGGKTLRMAINIAATGFDPARVSDQASLRINAHIFEAPLTYDPLARPAVLVPLTAERLPEPFDDFRRWVVTIRPGILFADDPVFQGKPRELVAADYVFTIKRYYDPATITEHLYMFENEKILGLSELRAQALKSKTPFPYDAPVEGLRVLDRYRFEVRLAAPSPRFPSLLTGGVAGAVAREVVQAYADDLLAHPVGTGPFRLVQWRRGSKVVLERNPRFRLQRFATVASAASLTEPHLRAAAEHLAGTRAPLVDRIELDTIEEAQPRWLAFLRGEHDALTLPPEFGQLAVPGGTLAPFLARQRMQMQRSLSPSLSHTFFNCEHPLVGGNTPAKVALRRAIALANDNAEQVRSVLQGQAQAAQGSVPPHCYGHDPALRSELGAPSPARAKALLDLHGYVDRNGDGWREQPDGSPLVLRIAFPPDRRSRALSELWHKHLSRVGLRVEFEFASFGELIKRSLAGQLMMWGFIWAAGAPDADFFLGLTYGPNAGQSSDSRFRLEAFDRLYERQRVLPNGPERLALIQQAVKLQLAYMPLIAHYHPIDTEVLQPQVRGALRHPFNSDWYRWIDIDSAA